MAHDFKIEKISGTAKVIDNGKTFTTYRKFAKAAGYEKAVMHFTELKEGEKVRLLAKGAHECPSFGTVYVIETEKGVRHLIGHKGIKIDEPAQIPEQTYVEIAETFGKQFRDAIRKSYSEGYADGFKQAKFDAEMDEKMYESPQQEKRDRIVEQAKADVEELKSRKGHYEVPSSVSSMPYFCNVEFVVNKEKRTVVALLKEIIIGNIRAKGIAKCAPGDCFNTHIGKAVALRKALGKSIDEYMNVPNPTEVRVGDVVRTTSEDFPIWGNGRVTKIGKPCNSRGYYVEDKSYNYLKYALIIDDSREVTE